MALILPSRATRIVQPQGPVEVDWSNPLARDLLAVLALPQRLWLTKTGPLIAVPSSAAFNQYPNPWGVALRHPSSFALGYTTPTMPQIVGSNGSATLLSVVVPRGSAANDVSVYGSGFGHKITSNVAGAPGTFGCQFRGGTAIVAGSGVDPDMPIVVVARSIQSVEQSLWLGGVKDPTTRAQTTTAMSSGLIGVTAARSGLMMNAYFMRALSDDEIRSLSANPWQLFKPASRSIIIGLGAGGGGGTSLSFESATFTMNATAFNTSLSAQLGSASFLLSGEELSSEAAALLEVDNTSFNLTGDSFTPNQTLAIGSSTFNQTSQDIDFLTNVNPDIGSTNFNFDATFLVLPFVLSISDALNGIIYTKLQENGYKGTLNEMLHSFFGGVGSLQDRERAWLILQTGVDPGTNQDLWNTYLESFGYTGSLPDMLKEFWINY